MLSGFALYCENVILILIVYKQYYFTAHLDSTHLPGYPVVAGYKLVSGAVCGEWMIYDHRKLNSL